VVALAFACGHARVRVRRKPRLAIIDSGDELAIDPANCAAHQIPASNGLMLTAMAAGVPCSVDRIGPVADHLDALAAALARAEGADLVVTSGGASVGDHDLIRPALERWGAEIAFWRVALKPGKPILVARRGRQLILGLPGNPVSSYVTAFLFMLPLMRALAGAAQALPIELIAPLTTDLPPVGKRLELLRGRWNGASVVPINEQDSSALLALSTANALIIRPLGAPAIEAGTPVPFHCLENGGIA
jgi:molybdopterin molybdotransferase